VVTVKSLRDFEAKLVRLQGTENRGGGGPPGTRPQPSFLQLNCIRSGKGILLQA